MSLRHNRDHFHKYMTADVALSVLDNLKLRWSSPLKFDDPFDVQREFGLGFDLEELWEPFTKAIEENFLADVEPRLVGDTLFARWVKYFRAKTLPKDREPFRKELKEGIEEGRANLERTLRKANEDWIALLPRLRILCVTELHDNLLMWSHYANAHRGVVMRLRCLPEHDTALLVAQPVVYQGDYPNFGTKTEWVEHLSGQRTMDFQSDNLFNKQSCVKSSQWEYEGEWRVVTLADAEDTTLYTDHHLLPQEIEAIYLGCKMAERDKAKVRERLVGDLAHVTVYQATTRRWSYALDFTAV